MRPAHHARRTWRHIEVCRLRLRPTKHEKRLIEELIPIARYVQARYREGRRIKVRWFSGSQPYDAILWSSGGLVQHRVAPRKLLVEVTTSVHQNDYLKRRLLHEEGGAFGVKGISRDKATGKIVSRPHTYDGHENVTDLADQVLERLKAKSDKDYPPGTALIIQCFPNVQPISDWEWQGAIDRVEKAQLHLAFREVFLFETVMSNSATLYGDRKRRRTR